MFTDADETVMDQLFGVTQDPTPARKVKTQELEEQIQRKTVRGEMPNVLSINVTAPEGLGIARASGLYTWSRERDCDAPVWRSRYHGYSVSLRVGKNRVWQLLDDNCHCLAETTLRNPAVHLRPPNEMEWTSSPGAGAAVSLTISGEVGSSPLMQTKFAQRMAATHQTYGLRHTHLLRTDREEITELVNRLRNFCRGEAFHRMMRMKIVGSRISDFIARVRTAQQIQREWLFERNRRFEEIFQAWREDDEARRAKVVAARGKMVTLSHERMHDLQKKLEAIDAVSNLHRKAAIVHVYRERMDKEYADARLCDDTYRTTNYHMVKSGVLNRILPISQRHVPDKWKRTQKLLGEARVKLTKLESSWQEARCEEFISRERGSVTNLRPPCASPLPPLTGDPGFWSLRFLEWKPPLPQGDDEPPALFRRRLSNRRASQNCSGGLDSPLAAARRAAAAKAMLSEDGHARPTTAFAVKAAARSLLPLKQAPVPLRTFSGSTVDHSNDASCESHSLSVLHSPLPAPAHPDEECDPFLGFRYQKYDFMSDGGRSDSGHSPLESPKQLPMVMKRPAAAGRVRTLKRIPGSQPDGFDRFKSNSLSPTNHSSSPRPVPKIAPSSTKVLSSEKRHLLHASLSSIVSEDEEAGDSASGVLNARMKALAMDRKGSMSPRSPARRESVREVHEANRRRSVVEARSQSPLPRRGLSFQRDRRPSASLSPRHGGKMPRPHFDESVETLVVRRQSSFRKAKAADPAPASPRNRLPAVGGGRPGALGMIERESGLARLLEVVKEGIDVDTLGEW